MDQTISQRLQDQLLFTNFSVEKSKYKRKDLHDNLRVWHKIILGCINPRPPSSSSDYFNINQKFMMYLLLSKQRINLPFILFNQQRDSIRKSKTTILPNKKMSPNIPCGRLLTDVFVESGLIKFLIEEANCKEDLTPRIGDSFNGQTLKNMRLIEELKVKPLIKPCENYHHKRIHVRDYP